MTVYTETDLAAEVVLDDQGSGNGWTMSWEGEPLGGWSLDLDKDGNDVVAFKQEGDVFHYIVYGSLSDDSTHVEYVNGVEVSDRELIQLQEGTAAVVNLSDYINLGSDETGTVTFKVNSDSVNWSSLGSLYTVDGVKLDHTSYRYPKVSKYP